MPESEDRAPIIIIRKKVSHEGHHGGAWKVAYADFVTAMMALFIVLWLLSSSEKIKKAVGSYFQDPTGSGKMMGSNLGGLGESVAVTKDDMSQLKKRLEQAMKSMPKFEEMKNNVELTITNEGLRVELIESEKGMFFESGNFKPTDQGKALLVQLATELGRLPNTIVIEGYTDAKPYQGQNAYSNWELSADRANAARRLMQESGLRADQVKQVRGFADQRLRTPKDPEAPSNRRVSVIVQYRDATAGSAAGGHQAPAAAHAEASKPAATQPPPKTATTAAAH